MARDEAKALRRYLTDGGEVYPGYCRAGSYAVAQLHLEEDFVTTNEDTHER